jgi:hypothetical protein
VPKLVIIVIGHMYSHGMRLDVDPKNGYQKSHVSKRDWDHVIEMFI